MCVCVCGVLSDCIHLTVSGDVHGLVKHTTHHLQVDHLQVENSTCKWKTFSLSHSPHAHTQDAAGLSASTLCRKAVRGQEAVGTFFDDPRLAHAQVCQADKSRTKEQDYRSRENGVATAVATSNEPCPRSITRQMPSLFYGTCRCISILCHLITWCSTLSIPPSIPPNLV